MAGAELGGRYWFSYEYIYISLVHTSIQTKQFYIRKKSDKINLVLESCNVQRDVIEKIIEI